jgi:phosphohistidine phosphatase
MKRLLLLRHAKAEAGDSGAGDHGRALSERGRRDAPRMGIEMQHRGYRPDLVLCSTSVRTIETWSRVAAELGDAAEVRLLDELYLAPAGVIAGAVQSASAAVQTLAVVGHSPGLGDLARALARKPDSGEELRLLRAMTEKFPTAALAVLDFESHEWRAVAALSGKMTDFLRPKDLTGG